MKMMTSNEIREMYLKFFEEKNHLIVPSASLIPNNDPTLLWINAGVTPLKKYFDGTNIPESKRMVSSQKCIRTNDIENVGHTARHHTFFEMLGNFSIGDYFKKEAIAYAFELLTSEKYFGIDKNKLYMTIYTDDNDAYNLWVEQGVDPSHIIRLEGNFWEIGDGPSGPDSEIFYDRGESFGPQGIVLLQEEIENDRYIEIWNNVFSMYNALSGVERKDYKELPSKNIDTGMGLERITSIIQGTKTNFETDLFMPIIEETAKLCGKEYDESIAFKVIADHIRTITFALSDGASFSNEGRGYVLRRLLRRAVRYGKKLNIEGLFLYKLVSIVVSIMNKAYPNLIEKEKFVSELVSKEEQLFQRTLLSGEQKLEELVANASSKTISGYDAFKLYDTYGFPYELTLEYLNELGFTTNKEEFDKAMLNQKKMARSARSNEQSMAIQNELLLKYNDQSTFVGYDNNECETKIIGLIKDNEFVKELSGEGYVVLNETPFYAEMGGQVADNGTIIGDNFLFDVSDVIKAPHKQHLHFGSTEGTIKLGDKVNAKIDLNRRESIAKNHSSVHLLQEALKEVLNSNVSQDGSKVDEDSARFDFTYQGKISDQEMILIEKLVNDKINTKTPSKTQIMTLEDAKKIGAIALFEEKYEKEVRVVTLYDSVELCGGTHVKNVGDINKFAIKSFESKGSNVYRVESTTDKNIESQLYEVIAPYNDEMEKLLSKSKNIILEAYNEGFNLDFDVQIDHSAPTSYGDIVFNREEVANVREKVKELEKKYMDLKEQKILEDLSSFDKSIKEASFGKYIIAKTNDYEVSFLKKLVDSLMTKIGIGFIFVANTNENNVNFVAKASKEIEGTIDCGAIIKEASSKSSGNGGGSKLFGQGGGSTTDSLDQILIDVENTINLK